MGRRKSIPWALGLPVSPPLRNLGDTIVRLGDEYYSQRTIKLILQDSQTTLDRSLADRRSQFVRDALTATARNAKPTVEKACDLRG